MADGLKPILVPGALSQDDLLLYTARDYIGVEGETTDEDQRRGLNALAAWSRIAHPVITRQHGPHGEHRTHLLPWAAVRITNRVTGVQTGFQVRTYYIDRGSVFDGRLYEEDLGVATIAPTSGTPTLVLRDPLPHADFAVVPLADPDVGGRTFGTIAADRRTIHLARWSAGNPEYLHHAAMTFLIVGVP